MARRGRFGRSASGSQNLSSLVYSLLKEERNNQESTMLTSYKNNMMSGSAAGLFTSNGSTLPATAANLVEWYKAQAAAAEAVGDSTGAQRFRTQAEEFRIQSLRDIETVLDNAYQNGNSIDLALIGGSGSAKIDGKEYEKWLNSILSDASMTASDRERLQSKLFTVSYNYAAENMVNGFNEKKYTANQLVAFYDKEIERARQNGLTDTSKTMRDIVAARAAAIQRASNDAAAARVTKVESALSDETDAMASAIQRLIKPVLKNYFSSTEVVDALLKDFGKGKGDEWLTRFSNAIQSGKIDYVQLFDAGASANGLSVEDMRSIAQVFGGLKDEVENLKDQGYAKELGDWISFADQVSTNYTDGAFAASTRPYVSTFNAAYTTVGGSVGVQYSGEPGKTADALGDLVGSISGAGYESNVTDSSTISQVALFGQGMLGSLIPSQPGVDSVEKLVDYLSKNGATAGMNKTDIANSIAQWLFVSKNNPQASISGSVPMELYNLGITTEMLDNPIGGASSGGLTTGDILRLHIESVYIPQSIRETVDPNGNPTRAIAYKMDPKTGEFAFNVIPSASVSSSEYVMSVGENGNIYYTQAIPYAAQEGTSVPIKFVPVPGGGNYAGGNDANDLIVIDFSGGYGKPMAFTAADIESFTSWYTTQNSGAGGDYSGFRLEPDQANPGRMTFTAGAALLSAITAQNPWSGGALADWMNATGLKVTDFYLTRHGSTILIGEDFVDEYRNEIFSSGLQGTDARTAVMDWLKNTKKISDPGGKILNMILNGGYLVAENGDNGLTWKIWKDGQQYTNSTDDTQDRLPPAPAGTKPDPNAVVSSDPSFGWGGNPQTPKPEPLGIGGTAGVRGTQTERFIPTSDLMEHTFRNLTPSLTPVAPIAPPPGGTAPIIAPGMKPDGPEVTAPAVSPGTSPIPASTPSMRPMGGSAPAVNRTFGVDRTARRSL